MGNMRIIMAGGGTGGHIFPAVAIARALQTLQPDTQLLFVGAAGKMEMEKVPQEGFEIVGLDIAGFNRSNIFANWSLPYKLLMTHLKSRSIIRKFKPTAVVGVGGYASFPVVRAAAGLGIPTVIQEQNSYAGKSNMILGRKAAAICVAYPGMERFFPSPKIAFTGNPVRRKIVDGITDADTAKQAMGLQPGIPTVFVTGGSLGAKTVNEAIAAGIDGLMAGNVQLLWQTGKPYHAAALEVAAQYPGRVVVQEFIRAMETAYSAADVVVSRAGALAIAELCIAGKAVVFVPYPYAAEDHQTSNALALTVKEAAVMVKNADAATQLIPTVQELLGNPEKVKAMSANIRKLAVADADIRIAEIIKSISK